MEDQKSIVSLQKKQSLKFAHKFAMEREHCDMIFNCPVLSGGNCHLAEFTQNQLTDGGYGDGCTKLEWFRFTAHLLTATELYCLYPMRVQAVLDKYRPIIRPIRREPRSRA